jgi:hypothetical protein
MVWPDRDEHLAWLLEQVKLDVIGLRMEQAGVWLQQAAGWATQRRALGS